MARKKLAYVGIDIGKVYCVVCVKDARGAVLHEGRYPNARATAAKFIRDHLSQYKCTAICESTGNLWFKTVDEFEKAGIPILLANPLKMKLSQSGNKTDKIDAGQLANRLRMKDVHVCHVYPRDTRRIRGILHQRIDLVRDRTVVVNRQHAVMDKYDYPTKAGNGNTSGEKYQAFLAGLKLDNGDTRLMAQLVRQVRFLNKEIEILENLISREALENEDAKLIMSIPGFDAFSALLVAMSIDGIGRFPSARKLISHMGLCPRLYQSGSRETHGHMKKDRDGRVTHIMMNAAMMAHRYDPFLSEVYEKQLKRHSALVARSHVANKLAKCIWHMLSDRKPYRRYNEKKYQAKLARAKSRGQKPVPAEE